MAVLHANRRQGGEAVVTVDGEVAAVLPLLEDGTYTATSGDGFSNTVVVERGRVCVRHANCPDQVCVRQGWIRYDGEMIVCLPHKLVVTVRGGDERGVDGAAK